MDNCVYFNDNFFSSGRTVIYNESSEQIGSLDLKSAFTSSLTVENNQGEVIAEGNFPLLSNKWVVKVNEEERGTVKTSFSFFSKKYSYSTDQGNYKIESPAFSREYTLLNEIGEEVATFKKVSGIFQSAAFELRNFSDSLLTEELITIVMGVNAIEKRNNSSTVGH